ncbi:MAG TPA: FHA domain-containing protein [Lacipirellulaceae bacterium]|nr:FHA domain-containing protein [Lacipirellulaceae bacterium]
MDVILKVIEGAKAGAKVAVKKNEFLIGRSQDCHLCAGSSAISRQHCAILRDDHKVSIKDLGSRNGTLVNGHKIEGEAELASGDEITVGPLKFMITISAGLPAVKKPEVKTVAQAVQRAAEQAPGSTSVDDITSWLLAPDASALNETQTIRIDDTNAAQLSKALEAETTAAAEAAADSKVGGEKAAKPAPGKLPAPKMGPTSKDSREAAVEALRAWSRRR